jgi:hypothetical protein
MCAPGGVATGWHPLLKSSMYQNSTDHRARSYSPARWSIPKQRTHGHGRTAVPHQATPARFLPRERSPTATWPPSTKCRCALRPSPHQSQPPSGRQGAREFTTAHPIPERSDTDRHQPGRPALAPPNQEQTRRDRRLPVLVPCRNILEAKLVR